MIGGILKAAEVAVKVAEAVTTATMAVSEVNKLSKEIGHKSETARLPDEINSSLSIKKENEVSQLPDEINSNLDIRREQKEKIEKQNSAIHKVEKGEKTLESTQEKGNYGEMKTDQDLREKGYERISKDIVTDLNDIGHQGIDGVYYNPDGIPQYLIVDAKYGTAQLADTLDGKQMSENWIDKRLDEAVGKEMADDIRMEKLINSDNVGSYVSHIDENGNVSYDKLDNNANIIGKDVKINE